MSEAKQPRSRRPPLPDDIATGSAVLRNARKSLHWFTNDDSLFAKGMRFGLVGASSGLIFAATTAALISGFGVGEKLSSVVGYLISMPINFFANRTFSFRSQGRLSSDALRFAALHVFNMAVTAAAMGASVNVLGLHYLFGIVGAVVLVPLANFVLMNVWVFRPRA